MRRLVNNVGRFIIALVLLVAGCAEPPNTMIFPDVGGNPQVDQGTPPDVSSLDPGSPSDLTTSDTTPLDTSLQDTSPQDTAPPDTAPEPSPCAANPSSCPCIDSKCTMYDSEDLCQPSHLCVAGQCVPDPSTVPDCTDTNLADCTGVICHSGLGICVNEPLPDGSACDDFQGCTTKDTCQESQCQGGELLVCDDGDPCTDDSCDHASGGCLFVALGCDDGDVCTEDSCDATGVCVHVSLTCDDSNECTDDSCMPGVGCMFQNHFGSCDDGNPCTVNDGCSGAGCQGLPKNCADTDPCTQDWCDEDSGECMHGIEPSCFVTFTQLNAQVLTMKCQPCHLQGQTAGGPVPRFVNNYAKTQQSSFQYASCQNTSNNPSYSLGGCMLYRVQNYHMPPPWSVASTWLWSMYSGSADYMAQYALTPLEVDMFVKWVGSGMPE